MKLNKKLLATVGITLGIGAAIVAFLRRRSASKEEAENEVNTAIPMTEEQKAAQQVKEIARAMGSKGGKASGEARRKKADE